MITYLPNIWLNHIDHKRKAIPQNERIPDIHNVIYIYVMTTHCNIIERHTTRMLKLPLALPYCFEACSDQWVTYASVHIKIYI